MSRLKFALDRKKIGTNFIDVGCNIRGKIGVGARLNCNVIIHKCVTIGKNCYIGSNTVIGEQGFSYAYHKDGTPEHIWHTGTVSIGDNVSIGAGVVIARGTVDETIIGDNVKIDDNTHIPHNVIIEESVMIVNGVMLGGGCKIGHHSFIGTGACIKDHIVIAPYTLIGVGAVVVEDTMPYNVIVGNPGRFLRQRDIKHFGD